MPATKPPPHPLAVLRRAQSAGIRRVLCYTSCGKDSIATLRLCLDHFDHVQPIFMYLVPGLSFQETYLAYIERLLSVSIIRLPHWMLGDMLRSASFRHPTKRAAATPKLTITDMDNYLRARTGIEWIASGEKAIDSVERNAMLRQCEGFSVKRRRLFPLTYWNHASVFNFLKSHRIALPPDYGGTTSRSFGSLWEREIRHVRDHHPQDWPKVVRQFPLIESQLARYDARDARETRQAQNLLPASLAETTKPELPNSLH